MSKRNKDIQIDETCRELAKVSQKSVGSRNSISHLISKKFKNRVYKLHCTKRFSRPGFYSLIFKYIPLCF